MSDLKDLIPLPGVWQSMARVEQRLLEVSTSDHEHLTEIAQHLLIAGGKRYRPLVAILAGQFGNGDLERPVEAGVADLIHTCGFYTLVSMTLNTFEVALPDGVEAPFPA